MHLREKRAKALKQKRYDHILNILLNIVQHGLKVFLKIWKIDAHSIGEMDAEEIRGDT